MDASALIDKRQAELNDWRGETYAALRKLINEADPDIKEGWKWNQAVWNLNGDICSLGAFKNHVKIHFFKGSQLNDRHKLINNGFDAKQMRAIDFFEKDKVDAAKFKELVREAILLNKN